VKKQLLKVLIYMSILSCYVSAQTSTIQFPLSISQTSLIDVYTSATTLPLSSSQSAGAGLIASTTIPAVNIFLDYSSNSTISQQKINLSIGSIPSGLTFTSQFTNNGTALNNFGTQGTPKVTTFNATSPSATILENIQNTAVSKSILEFKLDNTTTNLASAGSHLITLTFTLSDE